MSVKDRRWLASSADRIASRAGELSQPFAERGGTVHQRVEVLLFLARRMRRALVWNDQSGYRSSTQRRCATLGAGRDPALLRGLLVTPDGERLVPNHTVKKGKRGVSKVVVRPDGQVDAPGHVATQHDPPLLVALTRAFYWQQLLDDGVVASGSEIAQREGLHHSTVNELLRLTLLEPAIIQAILAGKQPRCMSLLWFQRNPLPTDWVAQREVVAAFDA